MTPNYAEKLASVKAGAAQRKLRFPSALPFLLPALAIYTVFLLYPIGYAFVMSFFRWDGAAPVRVFVGLTNYINLFTRDPIFWVAMRNSGIWVVLALTIPTTLGLALALALNQALRGRVLFRTIFYLPAVISSIAVATVWAWMYNPSLGIISALMKEIGLGALVQDWLGDRNVALYSVFAAYLWMATGPNMLLFLAGLQSVPQELVEAAKVDGANRLQSFRNVIVPSLRQTFIVVISLTIVNSLKAFDLVYALTFGGPGDSTQVLASWSYFQTFNSRNYGTGMAVAMVLLALTLLIVIPYVRWTNRETE